MIKKLAARNLVTHVPYKGSRLTSEGFLHANQVKRRQMLIEILLSEVVGLEGNLSEVASKMEFALEKSHELTLDRMLGYPAESRDGRKIPSLGREIVDSTPACSISEMTDGQAGTVTAIRISKENSTLMMKIDVSIGATVERTNDGFTVDGTEYRVSESILDSILVDTGGQ
jgi:DtxR family Mn-dependent transcriptional regulator